MRLLDLGDIQTPQRAVVLGQLIGLPKFGKRDLTLRRIKQSGEPGYVGFNQLIELDAEGNPGIKTVTEQGRVRFHRVDLDDISGEELLVRGLEDRVLVITTGQGFVRPGDRVDPVPEQQLARLNKNVDRDLE